ncbi:MAG: glutamate-5-semialdehyde dehydrogenase [Candidatus Omnitrophota bacterium]|nr:MAG: glutamate-5-semialdehyde dehydrogenase [Candidatus Omnitrophota bacterium]
MSAYVKNLVKQARAASYRMVGLSTSQKNAALKNMAKAIMDNKKVILKENEKDLNNAIKNKLRKSFAERLSLNEKRLKEMSLSLGALVKLEDPVNKIISKWRQPNGLALQKVRVPIGVVLIVYEARPNVTSDCVGLLFKTSNVGILRGGSDAIYSNKAIAATLKKAINKSGINFDTFFVVQRTDRKTVDELLKQDECIDLVIPRGGEALIRKVVETSHIPVIKHFKGICHIFVDHSADIKKALKVCVNAKVQRPSVCNAVETILVHKNVANKFLPLLKKEFDRYKVQIRADSKAANVLGGVKRAKNKDWITEFLDLIVAIKVVKDVDEAIAHINSFGSHHTESILTKDKKNAQKFVKEVDSACCFINISTRFSDGYQFGLGAEIGISTDKLHARGPMGLKELTTYKWIVEGNGQIRT